MNKDSEILKNLKNKMDGTISSLNHSLSGLRTGRASTALLDPIKVDAYGSDMFLNQIGSISKVNPFTKLILKINLVNDYSIMVAYDSKEANRHVI